MDDREIVYAVLVEAINDEYRAQARYAAGIQRFGPVTPLLNIVKAEGRHIAALVPLFHKYQLPIPADNWPNMVVTPNTLEELCELGIQGEIHNYQMYDRLSTRVSDPDILRVFSHLRQASHDHHLVAFQSCVNRRAGGYGMTGPGVSQDRAGSSSFSANSLRFTALGLGALVGAALVWAVSNYNKKASERGLGIQK